jgi:hypothetical protein
VLVLVSVGGRVRVGTTRVGVSDGTSRTTTVSV